MASLKDRAVALWSRQRARRAWLDHAVRAWTQMSQTNASLLAGALTFFSFLSLFPLILLGVSVTGFVLSSNPKLQRDLLDKVAEQLPGEFGDTVSKAINSAIDAKTGVGIVAVATLLFTGLGWINNLRQAVEQVWGNRTLRRSFVPAKAADLVVLAGLGVSLLVSVGLTAAGTALTGTILDAIGIGDSSAANVLARVLGIAVAVAADLVIFSFLLVRLPKAEVPFGLMFRAALLAAIGFEVLKLGGTYYIARVGSNPTYGAFGSIIGVLVWLNLVFRYLLYCTAWTATGVRGPAAVETGVAPLGVPPAAQTPVRRADQPAPPRRGVAWALILGALARRGSK